MADGDTRIVSGAESDIHDEPHIEGRRITVRCIRNRVSPERRIPLASLG